MRERAAFVKDCLIVAISDDFENFEITFEGTRRLAALKHIHVGETEVVEALESAIADGLAEAYVLSPHPPHSCKVQYSPDQLHQLWFYVTPQGKSALRRVEDL